MAEDGARGKCRTVDLSVFTEEPLPGDSAFPNAAQRKTAAQLNEALSQHGFFVAHNVGLQNCGQVISDLFKSTECLFAASMQDKIQNLQLVDQTGPNLGYVAPHAEVLSLSRGAGADLKECYNFSFGSTRVHQQDMSPCPPHFEHHAHRFWQTLASRAVPAMLRAISVALDIDYDHMAEMLDNCNNSVFRVLHYDPLDKNDVSKDDLIVRAAEHTDFGFFTLLFTDGPGLQAKPVLGGECCHANSDEWYDVPVPEHQCDALVNIGALLARLTNDWWPAAAHRVVTKTNDPWYCSRHRYSIACFFEPTSNTTITPLKQLCTDGETKYETISAGEYFKKRVSELKPK